MSLQSLVADEIDDEIDQHVFLLRIVLGNQQRQDNKCVVVDLALPVGSQKQIVLLQEPDEQQRGDTLVAVNKRMVFDYRMLFGNSL